MTANDRGSQLAAVASFFLGLSSLTVLLRCYVRLFLLKLFRLEDWLAVWTLVSSIAYTTFVLMSIQYGAGKHTTDVPLENIPRVLEMRWAGELTYVVTSMSLKFTIGIFLLRICSQTWHRVTIWAVLIACLSFNLFYVLIAAFQCQPVWYFWERYTNETLAGACLPKELITNTTYAAVGINAAADWILGLLPFALVRDLDLGSKQKLSVACILALGSVASTATVVRIFYVWQLTRDDDIVYEFTELAIWSTVENGLGLAASSIATLKPLCKSFLGVAAQHRSRIYLPMSSPWPSLKRASKSLKEHLYFRGVSVDRDSTDSSNSGNHQYRPHLGHYPDSEGPGEVRRQSGHSSTNSNTASASHNEEGHEMVPTVPRSAVSRKKEYNWQTFDAYESHRDVIAGFYHPISPRLARVRSRWYSDGSRYTNYMRLAGGGGGGYAYQHLQQQQQQQQQLPKARIPQESEGEGHSPSSWSLPLSKGRRSV
ncbi:hypothetical protein F5Y17DRAFT_93353 [Xylariaceae sp. FL0594]|nr:hypothetical protein F5Y17DRAFT_93353 [Xylariaceae sp. FL0594]